MLKVRDLERARRYMASVVIVAYPTAKIMEGAKSKSRGTPPMGAGKVYCATCVEGMVVND